MSSTPLQSAARIPSTFKRVLPAFALPLFFVVCFPLAFVSAVHAPAPHDLPVVVAGPQELVTAIVEQVDDRSEFAATQVDSGDEARAAVAQRRADGAVEIAVDQSQADATAAAYTVTTYVAGGGGRVAVSTVTQLGQDLAEQLAASATVVDVAPLSGGDGMGTALFYLLVYTSLAGYLVIIVMAQVLPRASIRAQFGAAAASSLLVPPIAFGIAAIWVGHYDAGVDTIMALLGVAALYVLTVGSLTILLTRLLGRAALFGVMALVMFLNFPSAGGSIPAAFLPGFFRWLHSWYFGAGAMESFRSIVYFDGHGLGRPLAQLVVWAVAVIVLALLAHALRSTLASARAGADQHEAAPVPDSVSEARPSLVTQIASVAAMPLIFLVLFTSGFVSALHAPSPHGVQLVLAGPEQSTAPLADQLSESYDTAFDIETTTSADEARQAVSDRAADGALVLDGTDVAAVVAGGGGPTVSSVVRQVANGIAAQTGGTVSVEDVAPLADGDSSGSSLFFLMIACTVGAFLSITMVAQTLGKPSARVLLATSAAAAVVVPSLAAGVIALVVSGLGLSVGTWAAIIGVGMLYTFTVGLVASVFTLLIGDAAVVPVMIVLVALNFPSMGGSSPAAMLPAFWQSVHGVWLGAGAFEAVRGLAYFDGARSTAWLGHLLVWAGAAAVGFIAVGVFRSGRRPRHAGRQDGNMPGPIEDVGAAATAAAVTGRL